MLERNNKDEEKCNEECNVSGMIVLMLFTKTMSFFAQEDLTEKVSNVNILMQKPMNRLFQINEGDVADALVESMEYILYYAYKMQRRTQ